jgi:hypothetical protein
MVVRMRWFAGVAVAIVVVGAATASVLMWDQGARADQAPPRASRGGFASIQGFTKIASGAWTASLCAGFKGSGTSSTQTHAPWYCAQRGRHRQQVWALTVAVRKYGIHHVPQPLPLRLARQHPGPNGVVVDVLRLASASIARRFLPIETHTAGYTALPRAAINGGVAARIDSLANDGLREFRFAWLSRASIVELNILGLKMTISEARRLALRARPS